ncbi:MAG: amidohydrolase family protein, partial [Patescibacteria group bacterium]
MASESILIRGGMIYRDKKFEDADVLIEDGTIKTIGDFSGALSKEIENIVDASGKYVVPGFIDLTNHSDTHWTLFAHPGQESMLMQGVTTIVGGNCGSSLAPLVKGEDISGIQKWTDITKINIDWRTLEEFFEELEARKLGVNFATLVGHGTLRRGVVGEDTRPAKENEIQQMQLLLERAMAEGAFGLSTSLGSSHEKGSDHKELLALFGAVNKQGGITKHHLKDEGKNILPAIAEIIGLARDANATAVISHFKFIGRAAWEVIPQALSMIESAREGGVKLWCDMFPYTRTGSPLYHLLPPWAVEGGKEKILVALKEPGKRAEILSHLKSLTLHYEKMTIAATLRDREAIGKTISEIAAATGAPPEEVIAALLENNDLKVSIFNEVILPEHLD